MPANFGIGTLEKPHAFRHGERLLPCGISIQRMSQMGQELPLANRYLITSQARASRAGVPFVRRLRQHACDYCFSTLGTEARWSTQCRCERVQICDLGISCSCWRTVPTRMK